MAEYEKEKYTKSTKWLPGCSLKESGICDSGYSKSRSEVDIAVNTESELSYCAQLRGVRYFRTRLEAQQWRKSVEEAAHAV